MQLLFRSSESSRSLHSAERSTLGPCTECDRFPKLTPSEGLLPGPSQFAAALPGVANAGAGPKRSLLPQVVEEFDVSCYLVTTLVK